MIVRTRVAVAIVLLLAPILGSCSPFAGFVADHWPHIAGGEPNGVPPRPGAPGYAEFIAHQQDQAGTPTGATASAAAPANGAQVVQGAAAPPAQAPSAAARQPAAPQRNVTPAGLY